MQHDHHCVVSFMGMNWRIYSCSRNRINVIRRGGLFVQVETIDTTKVRWDDYCEAAVQLDYLRSPGERT